MVPIEEVEALQAKLVQFQIEKDELQIKCFESLGEITRLKRDLGEREEALQKNKKRLRESEDKRQMIGEGLFSANANLVSKGEELEKVLHSKQKVGEFGELATKSQKEWRTRYHEQVAKTQEVSKQLEERLKAEIEQRRELENHITKLKTDYGHFQVVVEECNKYKAQCLQEKEWCMYFKAEAKKFEECMKHYERSFEEQTVSWSDKLNEVSTRLGHREKVLSMYQKDAARLGRSFVELIVLFNTFIDEFPEKLKKAEIDLHLYSASQEVREFLKYCRETLVKYKEEVAKTKVRFAA